MGLVTFTANDDNLFDTRRFFKGKHSVRNHGLVKEGQKLLRGIAAKASGRSPCYDDCGYGTLLKKESANALEKACFNFGAFCFHHQYSIFTVSDSVTSDEEKKTSDALAR